MVEAKDTASGYISEDVVQAYVAERIQFGWKLRGERAIQFADIKPGDHILDLCSGPGMVSKVISERVGEEGRVLGIEISENFVKYSRNFCRNTNTSFVTGNIEELDRYVSDQKFDKSLILASWPWIKEKEKVCSLVYNCLKPGGGFLISLASDDLEDSETREFFWNYRENLKTSVKNRFPNIDLSYFDKLPAKDQSYVDGVIVGIENCSFILKQQNRPGRTFTVEEKLSWYDTPARTEWVGNFTPGTRLEIIHEAYNKTVKEVSKSGTIKRCTYYLTFRKK